MSHSRKASHGAAAQCCAGIFERHVCAGHQSAGGNDRADQRDPNDRDHGDVEIKQREDTQPVSVAAVVEDQMAVLSRGVRQLSVEERRRVGHRYTHSQQRRRRDSHSSYGGVALSFSGEQRRCIDRENRILLGKLLAQYERKPRQLARRPPVSNVVVGRVGGARSWSSCCCCPKSVSITHLYNSNQMLFNNIQQARPSTAIRQAFSASNTHSVNTNASSVCRHCSSHTQTAQLPS